MSIEELRQFVNDWALVGAAVLGLIVAYDKARGTLGRWLGKINLYHRVRIVEEDVEQLKVERIEP